MADDRDLRDLAHALGIEFNASFEPLKTAIDPTVTLEGAIEWGRFQAAMSETLSEARTDPRGLIARHIDAPASASPRAGGPHERGVSAIAPAPRRGLPDADAIYRARAAAFAGYAAARDGGPAETSTSTATAPAAPRGLPDHSDVYARRAARMGGG